MANPQKLKTVQQHSRRDILFSVARLPKSQKLFVGSSDFGVYGMDLSQKKLEPKLLGKHGSYVTGVALSGTTLVSGSYDCRLIWWDTTNGSQIRAIDNAHQKWIRGVMASPDGNTIASVADDMVCRLWDAKTGKRIHELRGHREQTPQHYNSMLYACAFSPDSRLLATADKVGHIAIWDRESGRQIATAEAPGMYTWDPRQRRHSIGGIRSLAFSPDGKLLAAGGIGKIGNIDHLGGKARLEVFETSTGKKTHQIEAKNNGLIQHLEFHPKGEWLLGAGGANNGIILFFDLKNKKILKEDKAPMHIHDLARDETFESFYAVGHGKVLQYEMKG